MEGVSVAGCGGPAVGGCWGCWRPQGAEWRDIFMYCRGMFWTATTKHNISWLSHQGEGKEKKKKRKSLRGQSINSMQLQVRSHWTQSGTIPPLSGGRDTVRARPLRATAGICSLPVQSVHERHFHPTLRYCQYNSSETVSDFIAASLIVFTCLKLHRAH